jgi:integrase/recombinase XerD
MRAKEAIREYIEYKRAMGMRFKAQAYQLEAFGRQIGDIELAYVTRAQVREYIDGRHDRITSFWFAKFDSLRGFFNYVRNRRYIDASVLPDSMPKRPLKLTPFLYSVNQVRQLLAIPDSCYSPNCGMQPHTVRTMILLLYGTGLRIGEALRLRLGDVDLNNFLLTVRETKFFKSRFVPIGSDLNGVLRRYDELQRPTGASPREAPFLVGKSGARISIDIADHTFQWLRTEAGVLRFDGGRYQPRLHDFRHRADSPIMPNVFNWILLRAVWSGFPCRADRLKSA